MTLRTSIKKIINSKIQTSTLTIPVSDQDLIIQIKSHITVSEMVKLVKEAAYNVFIEEVEYQYDRDGQITSTTTLGRGCIFAPYYKKLAFSKALLNYYTNASFFTENTDDLYLVITATDLMQKVISKIDPRQLSDIQSAVDDLIEFRKLEIVSQEKAQLNRIRNKIQEINCLLKEFDEPDVREVFDKIKNFFQNK